jgi:hypothetical protein
MRRPRARDETDSNVSLPLRCCRGVVGDGKDDGPVEPASGKGTSNAGGDSILAEATWMRKQNSVMRANRRSIKGPTSAFPVL